jgi:hypothetical protein
MGVVSTNLHLKQRVLTGTSCPLLLEPPPPRPYNPRGEPPEGESDEQ